MEGLSRKFSWLVIVAMVTMTISSSGTECRRSPVLHRVGGGKYSWEPNVNFTEWASTQHFYEDFGFDKHKYNVVQVRKTRYEECSGKDFVENVTRGGRDVFNLTETKTYYFICSRGDYCFHGMKVEVSVEPDPPPPPPSSSSVPPPSSPHHLIISAAAAAPSPSTSNTYYYAQFLLIAFFAFPLLCIFHFGCI